MVKTPAPAITFVGMMLLAACTTPPDQPAALPKNVRVEYVNPEKFTDVGDSAHPSDGMRADYLEQLRRHLVRRATLQIPAEQNLTVSITNIDMAGGFEPWRSQLYDVRIIRDVYPPRIDLDFTLKAADGPTIREGRRQLRDLAFRVTSRFYRDDPLRYEKALLDDWLERELKQGKN